MILSSVIARRLHRPRSIFFFNDTATTEIYTLSLHDALPISACIDTARRRNARRRIRPAPIEKRAMRREFPRSYSEAVRSEEHTSELQSHLNLVCRLLLEKKKTWQVGAIIPLYSLLMFDLLVA